MQLTEHKTFQAPDETREFPKGRAEILKFGGGEVGLLVFQPGWRWSTDVKPIASSITSAAGSPFACRTAPSSSPARAT
jgi:hypothetical protein